MLRYNVDPDANPYIKIEDLSKIVPTTVLLFPAPLVKVYAESAQG